MLLTPEEVTALRASGIHWCSPETFERLCATTEELMKLAHDRLEALLKIGAERDGWREIVGAREADIRTLATALNDIAACRTEDETSAVIAEVLPDYREWAAAPHEQGA